MKKLIIAGSMACLLIIVSSCNSNKNEQPETKSDPRTTPTIENTPSTPTVTVDSLRHDKPGADTQNKKEKH